MKRILLSTLVAVLPAAVMAADADHVVEARQGYFSLVALDFGPLAAIAKGAAPYDAAVAKAHATNLVTLSKYDPSGLYAPGTSQSDVKDSRAKAEIWKDPEGFKAKGTAFFEAIAALEPAAGAGQKELAAAVGKLGAACKDCHDTYRAKD